jgi:hypothetical protein
VHSRARRLNRRPLGSFKKKKHMSRILRQQGMWPASSYSRYLWLSFGLWEDIIELVGLYKVSMKDEARVVLARHILVDFDTLDELIKEYHDHIKKEELTKLSPEDQERMINAFDCYHRIVQPHRRLLKKIRNNLGSHRTGMPWQKAPDSGVDSSNEWGKWEQFLSSLEKECDLEKWKDIFNSAYVLLNILKNFNLDAWYKWPVDGEIQFFLPILPPGYYPNKNN